MTSTEFLGCVLFLAGGIWIGSTYLGVDLNRAAYVALDETELLGQIPSEWRPANPDCPEGDCPDPTAVRLSERVELKAELDSLRLEVARLRAGAADASEAVDESILDTGLVESRDHTVAYWQELSEVIEEVEAIQRRVADVTQPTEQAHVLVVRRRALDYGERAIALLEIEGVDERAVETGGRIARWYAQSGEALSEASEPSNRQAANGRTVSAERVWSQTQRQHAKQTELVRRKADEAFRYLNARYLVELPPLAL